MTDQDTAFATASRLHQSGDFAGAERGYRELLAIWPDHAPSLTNLGVLLVKAGRLREAADCYRLALAVQPDYSDAHFNLGNLYRRSQQFVESIDHYRACLRLNPNHTAALFNLGLVCGRRDDLAGAIESFQRLTQLEPGNAEGFGRLGDVLVRAGRLEEGIRTFRRVVELKPDDPRGLYNLALALANAGQRTESDTLLRSALALRPDYAEAHNAYGLNRESQRQFDEALAHYQEAVRLKPELADAWSNLGTCLAEQGCPDEAIACLRESLRLSPGSPAIHSNLILLLNYSCRTPLGEIRAESERWAGRFAGTTPEPPPVPLPHNSDRQLRIGYLSADFRGHTVAGFIETILGHHDRRQVEVYAYASVAKPDETTERLRRLADHWRSIHGVPDAEVAVQIRNDRIDVLIDLGGHTAGNRLLVLAARPAPLQVSLFGYPHTTGLAAVDYRITDAVSDPPGQSESLYVERLLYLSGVPWISTPPEPTPAITNLPAGANELFTFGCLNNPAKLSITCLETWARLLRSTPGTRLALLAGESRTGMDRLIASFAQARIDRDRVEFVHRSPRSIYFETYSRFDLTLDPFPYNGGITTGDSLWMGVPVLTVAGNDYRSRQGAMVMRAVGLDEFVAESPDDLIRRAQDWVQRRSELAEIRVGLRDRIIRSPLTDGSRYVQRLEAALRQVWHERLKG